MMPANFLNLGLIHTVFPAARIIHMRRHPIDTCLSIYFQTFSTTHPYANDLNSLAHYYQEYVRMMDHWREVLPPATLLEVPYEALVADQEGLDAGACWNSPGCRGIPTAWIFTARSGWSSPPANGSVRQKMHKASAGRWRHYAAHVGTAARAVVCCRRMKGTAMDPIAATPQPTDANPAGRLPPRRRRHASNSRCCACAACCRAGDFRSPCRRPKRCAPKCRRTVTRFICWR